jgi:molybdopterin-guanine dinucleotide biosynthesis protein B
MPSQIPLVTVTGKSKAGKTTLLEKLIAELKRRGYRVGTIKHHSHPGFEIDQEGKDSWRHALAGSQHVVIASPDRIASYRSLDHELSLDEIASTMVDVDIILTEGYMQAGKPTIQVVREANGLELIVSPEQCLAVATDARLDVDTPCYDLNDPVGLADLLEQTFLSATPNRSRPAKT